MIIPTIIQITQILKINNLYASDRLVGDFINSYNCNTCSRTKGISNSIEKNWDYFGKLKNTLSSFQREVNSVTEDIDIEKDINKKNLKKDNNKNNE